MALLRPTATSNRRCRPAGIAAFCLVSLAIWLGSLGLAWMAFHGGTAMFSLLFGVYRVNSEIATTIDQCLVFAALVAALGTVWHRHAAWPVLVAVVFVAMATAATLVGGAHHSELSLAAHSTRYAIAVAAALLLYNPGNTRCCARVAQLLALASTVVFMTHGYEAIRHTAPFIDLIIASLDNGLAWRMDEGRVRQILTVIGVVDVLVALLVWTRCRQFALRYMAVWGAITLASRTFAFGGFGWAESFVRVGNAVAPLAALLIFREMSGRANREELEDHAI